MPEVEILTGERVLETRTLWEEVFTEDTKSFLDYYYSHKATKNICFVIRIEREIVSMLHLTPYDICVKKEEGWNQQINTKLEEFSTFYLVGVATKVFYRHRGYMTSLLECAFSYMKERDIRFTFLMPANPAIYTPFGFRYIYERLEYAFFPEYLQNNSDIRLEKAENQDCSWLSEFAMKELTQKYRFFLKRDEAYFQTLLKELASENGFLYLVYVNDMFAGYFTYACEEEAFIQEVLIKKEYESSLIANEGKKIEGMLIRYSKRKPIIMAKYMSDDAKYQDVLYRIAEGTVGQGFMNELV